MQIMHEGHCSFDEMWQIIDARASSTTKNKLVADILLRSRKRDLTYMFTTQLLDMLDKRLRKVLDFTSYCLLNQNETIGKVFIFRGGYPKEHMMLKNFMFYTQGVFELYDTNEEIDMMVEGDGTPPKIVFQESRETPPKYFDTWEACDVYGEKWWEKNGREILSLLMGKTI
jgi:hypothetical protein